MKLCSGKANSIKINDYFIKNLNFMKSEVLGILENDKIHIIPPETTLPSEAARAKLNSRVRTPPQGGQISSY